VNHQPLPDQEEFQHGRVRNLEAAGGSQNET
jgi:hypothetical protein